MFGVDSCIPAIVDRLPAVFLRHFPNVEQDGEFKPSGRAQVLIANGYRIVGIVALIAADAHMARESAAHVATSARSHPVEMTW